MNSTTNGLKRHPLSALFSRLDLAGDDLAALVEDIKDQGLLSPITTHEGMVLDGWNRYTACGLAGVEPVLIPLHPGADPWEFVKGSNMLRRHMSPAERVAVLLLKTRMDGEFSKLRIPTEQAIAQDLEVSAGTAHKAAVVAKANDPALVDALADKKVSLDRAAELAKMPEHERHAALEAPKPSHAPKKDAADVEALQARVEELEAEREDLKDRLFEMAQNLKETMEENDSIRRILDAEDLLAGYDKEVKRVREGARLIEARNTSLSVEVNELKRFAKMWKGKFERLEKTVKVAEAAS